MKSNDEDKREGWLERVKEQLIGKRSGKRIIVGKLKTVNAENMGGTRKRKREIKKLCGLKK